jgi:hypothetical protein
LSDGFIGVIPRMGETSRGAPPNDTLGSPATR